MFMIRFQDDVCSIYIGVSNNWKRMHGYPMSKTKRYRHERKWIPKSVRCKYHTMKRVGCDDDLIYRNLARTYNNEKLARAVVYERR
jgi:hypothetical protein